MPESDTRRVTQALTLPLPLAFARILSISRSHTDIPIPLTPFMNWAKAKGASLVSLNQHKTDNPFLFRCNHVAIRIQTTKIVCNLSQTTGERGPLRSSLSPNSCPNSLRAYDLKCSVLHGIVCKCCVINQIYYFCVTSDRCACDDTDSVVTVLRNIHALRTYANTAVISCKLKDTVFKC